VLLLAIKVLLSPILLGICVFAGHRWGAALSGWLLGLPLVSGPVSFFLLSEHGAGFAENAARGTLIGLVAAGVFCVVYTRIAESTEWWESLPVAAGAGLGATYLLARVHMGLGTTVLVVAALLVGLAMAADRPTKPTRPVGTTTRGLLLRMSIASAVVIGVTTASGLLGAQLSGLLTSVPVIIAIMATTSHHTVGSESTKGLLRGTVVGLWGGAAFFAVVSVLVLTVPPALTYIIASLAAVATAVVAERVARIRMSHRGRLSAT
jgi:hypothetical protein